METLMNDKTINVLEVNSWVDKQPKITNGTSCHDHTLHVNCKVEFPSTGRKAMLEKLSTTNGTLYLLLSEIPRPENLIAGMAFTMAETKFSSIEKEDISQVIILQKTGGSDVIVVN